MPTSAFLAAAKQADREPVVLLTVESIAALKASSDTLSAWGEAKSTDATIDINGTLNSVTLDYTHTDYASHWTEDQYWTISESGHTPPHGTFTATHDGHLKEIGVRLYWDRNTHLLDGENLGSWFAANNTPPRFAVEIYNHAGTLVHTTGWISPAAIGVINETVFGYWPAEWNYTDNIFISIPVQAVTAAETLTFKLKAEESQSFGYTSRPLSKMAINYTPTQRYHGQFRYIHNSGTIQTKSLDLGSTPTAPAILEIDDTVPAGCSISYTARGSADNSSWTNLGAVVDGDTLTAYRYYDVTASLTADGGYTPVISSVRVREALTENYSTHRDKPVQGAKPYIIENSVSTLSSKIELMGAATTGELSLQLQWTKKTSDMLATGYLKNKAVICKLGFTGLGESDYEPYFTGTWFDHADDHEKLQISVKTRDTWKQFKTKVPDESYFLDGTTYQKIDGKVYTLSGNIIDVILAIVDLTGVPDRYIDRAAFTALKSSNYSSGWDVSRDLTESSEADKLMIELAVSAGLFLPVLANGKITPVHYDTKIAGSADAVLDARKYRFSVIEGGQKELFTRQQINYHLIAGKSGGSKDDFDKGLLWINTAAETAWGESYTKEWNDKWGLAAARIEELAQRMEGWYATPRQRVKVEGLPPKYMAINCGSVVEVDWLRLPAASASWPGYSDGKKFLVMSRSINPRDLSLSFDLFEVGSTTYQTGSLPAYNSWGLFPPVTGLTLTEMVISRENGNYDNVVRVAFTEPTDFRYGGAEIWARKTGGLSTWNMVQAITYGSPTGSRIVYVPVIIGGTYEISVCTINSSGLRQTLATAPTDTITISGVNYSASDETLDIPGPQPPGAAVPAVFEPGVIMTPAQELAQAGVDIVNKKEDIRKTEVIVDELNSQIILKVNGTDILTAGFVNGVSAVGIRGDMYLDGTISAAAIKVDEITAQHVTADAIYLSGAELTTPQNTSFADASTSETIHVWQTVDIVIDADLVNRPLYFSFYCQLDSANAYVRIAWYEPDGVNYIKSFLLAPTTALGPIYTVSISNAFTPTSVGTWHLKILTMTTEASLAMSNANLYTMITRQ